MTSFFERHPAVRWTGISMLGLLVVLLAALALLDWNALRGPLARAITAKTGHPTTIDGNLSAHIWSWEPTFTVEGLDIRNPSWAEQQPMLRVAKLVVQISLGHLLRGQIVLSRLEVTAPVVNLERKKNGEATWASSNEQLAPSDASPHLPAIRRLIVQNGKINVVDRIRKLSLIGTIRADDEANSNRSSAFQLRCSGSLNGRSFKLNADGGPLINVDPNQPYHFTVDLSAGDIALAVQASIPKPFDLAEYDAKFELSGADLADAYYLTNLALPNTAKYHLSGNLHHVGTEFRISDFRGSVGSTDLEGNVAVIVGNKRPKLTAELTSTRLDIADLGPTLGNRAPVKASLTGPAKPAAAVPAAESPAGWLLPDADLQVNRVRGMDADVNFNAQSVISPTVPLQHVRLHVLLNDGVLRLDPLSFAMRQGQFAGSVQIDASAATPVSDIDMNLKDIDLAQFGAAGVKRPPLEGLLAGRVKLHGTGESVHKVAASANGSVSLVIPHGQIRTLLAELTGIDVAKGLGLLLAKDQQQTELRCGVAAFEADKGQLTAKSIVLDTSNVLITGHGDINLDNERIDLAVQGDPKKLRLLRVRTPIKVGGTFLKPHVGVEPVKTLLQAGAGTVLATLLTPVAAVLAFVDPGLAKNADCSALLAQATPAAPAAH